MEQIDIKDISGAIQLTTLINEGCKRKFTLMKEDYIMLKFSLENPIYFKLGSYVECNFELFEMCDLQKPAFNTNTAGYDYELRLDAYYWKWKNKIFKYTPETTGQEASWNLTAPLDVQAGIVLRNLKALGYTYKGQDFVFSIDSTVENKSQLMSYDNINILDACFEMAKKWDCECWVTENIIHFGRCESGDAVDFEIGKNVQEMSQSESRSTYATRIYAFGSTKNIPSDYRPVDETVVVNGVVQRRLMLPEGTPYIDAYPDMTTEEAVEQVVIFDEVYPRRTGIMSDVTTIEVTDKVENEDGTTTEEKWNAYRFRDTGVNFSEKYILPGQELRIRFASGLLNGLEFAVKFNPEGKPEKLEDGGWNPEAQLWEIVRNEDYGRPLPGDVLFPQDGDEYVLSGWDSTKITELGLVGAAEQELKEKTEKYAAKSKIDPSTYGCTMMSNDAYREDGVHNFYGIGQKVNLINKAYFENGRQSRVIGFEFNLDYSFDSPVYTVGETAAYSRIGELEEKVESLTLKGQTYTGDGGSGVYVIGSHDSTPATDHNVYSALRSLIMFMRKDTEERTGFLLSLLGGTVIKKYAKFGDFVTGVSGGYIGEDARAELEALVLRSSLSVPELRFNRQTYFEGYNTISPGGGLKIKSFVANSDGSYTVTPDLEDGVPLGQKPDDILLGFWHDKSVTTGDFIGFRKIQYRITSADYDEKTFVMVPRPGYEFVPHNEMRLGQTGNFTDKERQTYIIIDVRDGNCCITLVDNANTWDPEPAQMKSWFGKKKGMTINGINCDRFSAVLQDIIMTGLIFQIDEITGSTVRVPIDFPSWEPGRKYAYYSRVPHNGSTWLCVNDKGTISEPSENNPDWLVSAAKGDKGDPGLSVIGGGHWESSKTPYEVNTMVTLAGCVFISKVKTSNPPIRIARFRNGSYRRKKDGGYILAGKSADWTVHEDWEMLLDGRELKGESITFLGEFASHPSNPKEGNSYRNTADHCTYIYRNGLWMVMVKDGTDGKDGKGYEWIYTRTNIIGLTPDKPESKQQDDYIPEGWTDDFLGVDADHQVEWACKRVKRDGVWSEWSTPAPVHRWSKDGESNIMADLDNEMVSVALTSTGVTTSAQSWTTHVSMWYGTEKLTLESLTVSTPAGFTASTSKATGAVAISVAAGKSVPEQNTVTITLAAMKNGQLYTRELTFKITGVRGGADGSDAVIYSLVTSVTMVSKNKNGGYSVASVSCRRMKTVGAVTTATTDGELKYSRDGAAEVPIGDGVGVASGNFTSSLKFVFYVNGQAVDVETVPMVVDGSDGKDGESITFLGEFASHPSNPKEGNSYRNTADHCTYIYRNGLWMVMVKDGTDGKDGKGYEWIYTRTNIIGLTPDKPESKQQDDYIPEGWTDDFLGVDADHQVEWACKRVKRDGVWSEWSTPAPVHRWSKDGESNIMADLDNEMVSVALTSTGVTTSAQSWTTHVSMWYGTEKLTLESLTVSTPAGFTASTSKATGAVAISVAAGKSVPEQNTVTITLAAMKNGQLYTRELTFKITGVRGGADGSDAVIYSLVTSVTMVSKNKNGGYSVASVSCRRMKTVGAVTTATTDGELKYSRDGAAEVPIGDGVGVASGNFTSSLKFVFYVNGQAVDVETVPMVVDGSDGKDGESITAAGHWESANTPYAKNSTVSFAGGSYLSKVQTSNPPLPLLRVRGGRYLRKKDGGYILSGKRSDKAVNSDWQEMTSGVEPSASYWLDSPVSTINFTSTGTPSPSAFVVTMKQNVGGNVSDTNRFYLVARKYNGSWLAHVGATLSNQISVPATAGYTQFAVRAYQSASDANAWNNNFVAEKGVGVANDGAIGATGATGAFPRDRGVFASGQTYVWNADYRDKVIYLIGGVYYNFLVKNYGASVTVAPTSANGDSNWEAMQKFVNIATDTLFADGANVAGFMFKNNVLKSHNDEGETLLINGVTGYFKCKNAEITGTITADKGRIGPFSIASGVLSSKILYENETNKYVGFNLSAGQIEFYNERTFANVRIGGNTQFVTIEGIKYDAGIDIQSPNAMIGMHIKTPSIPLFVEGGNIFLHPNNDSYVSLRGIVGNWRNISVSTSLNNNDDNVMFINTGNIEVTLPPDVPGHTIYFKRMSGGVRLTGGRILPAPGGREVSYIDLDFASGFIKCMGNYWVMFYCG